MDVLTDVLRVSALGNAILNRSELVAPWELEVGVEVRAAIHIVQRGLCWLRVAKRGPVRLVPGDVVLVPGGRPTRSSMIPDPGGALRTGAQAAADTTCATKSRTSG